MKVSSILPFLLTGLMLVTTSALAEEDVVHGEIEFEQHVKKKKTYEDSQDELIDILSELSSFTANTSEEAGPPELKLLQDHLLLLNALYLHCSVTKGVCPSVLDTILEFDVIKSRVSGKSSCNTMKQFWKSWIANDMQKRHQFQVKTGFLKKTDAFKKQQLPRYLSCSDTVARALEENAEATNAEYFQKRYHLPSVPRQAVTDTLGKMEKAKSKEVNLLFITGTDR